MLKSMVAFKFGTRRASVFIAQQTSSDLEFIGSFLASKEIRSEINSEYGLNEISKAMQSIESGHTRGKIIVCL